MERPLEGKIALVTGVGRSTGIGYALCEALAQNGAHIFYTYWKAYDLEEDLVGSADNSALFAEDFERHGVQALCSELDLSEDTASEKLLALVRTKMGEPSILIHNACVSQRVPLFSLDARTLDAHYAVNVKATTLLTCGFLKQCPHGSTIIHMTSGQGLGVMDADELAYTVTKAGIDMLVAQLAPVVEARGSTILAVDPGPTDTGWMTPQQREEIEREGMIVNTPLTTAQLVLSLLCGETHAHNGEVVRAIRSEII